MVELRDIPATTGLAVDHLIRFWGLLAQQTNFDPRQSTRLLVALMLIIVVGFVLIASVLIWGRRMRRLFRRHRGPSKMSQDDWYAKPLVPDVDDARDEMDDTIG